MLLIQLKVCDTKSLVSARSSTWLPSLFLNLRLTSAALELCFGLWAVDIDVRFGFVSVCRLISDKIQLCFGYFDVVCLWFSFLDYQGLFEGLYIYGTMLR